MLLLAFLGPAGLWLLWEQGKKYTCTNRGQRTFLIEVPKAHSELSPLASASCPSQDVHFLPCSS